MTISFSPEPCYSSSDHIPLLLKTDGDAFSHPKPFRFEAMWITDPSCEKVVHDNWTISIRGSPPFRVCKWIKAVKVALKEWNKSHFGLIQTRIHTFTHSIATIQAAEP